MTGPLLVIMAGRSRDRAKMAAVKEEQFAALQILLKASSKDMVRQLCHDCFSTSAIGSARLIDATCSTLSATSEEANQLIRSLHHLTRCVVYRGLTSAEEILALFPETFHQSLKNLLTKIILQSVSGRPQQALSACGRHVVFSTLSIGDSEDVSCGIFAGTPCLLWPGWRQEAEASQICLPRLVDLDWRVDIKTSSDSISRMAVPTCLLQMKIQEDAGLCGGEPAVSAVTVELSKETLDTMLDGLGRIRDQLSAVASK